MSGLLENGKKLDASAQKGRRLTRADVEDLIKVDSSRGGTYI